MKYLSSFLIALVVALGSISCNSEKSTDNGSSANEPAPFEQTGKVTPPDWTKKATLYELNIRQFTEEGTFSAVRPHLSRLANMGVDIIWLMPIHPISIPKRKGTLGSYYAVSDFRAVNPEYGTRRDLQQLISDAHNHGMKVIIDWVPHHTGWDHPWITEHPEWYSQDADGNIIDPINEENGEPWGWTDVAELNLSNPEMRKQVRSDMMYWVDEVGIDGFRVDHAHGLPDDYWDEVSSTLSRADRSLFMLAEGEHPRLRNTGNFQATYGWAFHHATNAIASGEETVDILDEVLAEERENYSRGYHVHFTSNHDENSWSGTVFERYGDGHRAFAVLTATIDGMPLLYSGQEAPIRKRLEFFEKDPIDWNDYAYEGFYRTLFTLKKRNAALHNGEYGGLSRRINTSETVYAFEREKDGDRVVVIINLSAQRQETTLDVAIDRMRDVFGKNVWRKEAGEVIELGPWEYLVLSNR